MSPDNGSIEKVKCEDLEKIVTPKGQIRLPIQTSAEVVKVDFIVVDAYSPYTIIVARPWLYALGAVSSTLH